MDDTAKRKPLVGLIPLVDEERESYWMLPGYMRGVHQAGGLPVMLPLTDDAADIAQMAREMDAFLLTGGHDVSPAIYGEEALPTCGTPCPARDAMEIKLLKAALALDKPVLGICRGIQLLNAAMGGTLYQDLPSQRPSPVHHHQSPPYDHPVHSVSLCAGTPLAEIVRKETLAVNSYHHQAVKTLSPQLVPMAFSEDGLIEAVFMPNRRFVWGVQWHPEFSFKRDDASRKIFEAFVGACLSE